MPLRSALLRGRFAATHGGHRRCLSGDSGGPTRQGTVPGALERSASHIDPGSRSGLSDISMALDESGMRRWVLTLELELMDLDANGRVTETVLPLSQILDDLDLPASISFLRKVRATQIQKIICEGRTIFLTLGDLRAIISADRVLLFGTRRPMVKDQAMDLSSALSVNKPVPNNQDQHEDYSINDNGLPYEMRCDFSLFFTVFHCVLLYFSFIFTVFH